MIPWKTRGKRRQLGGIRSSIAGVLTFLALCIISMPPTFDVLPVLALASPWRIGIAIWWTALIVGLIASCIALTSQWIGPPDPDGSP